ncbi:MAG: biotin carboxylase N-terminal domain-containing protein [Pseudomonadota bacterium]
MTINCVLIANRGEIACRIIRAAHSLGLQSVAVFTDVDAAALHVSQATHSIQIGDGSAADGYLNPDVLIAAAHDTGADAIHPGYGFLSEDAGFARAVAAAGLTFVGPDADVIELMGDKARARAYVAELQVPVVPGFNGASQTDNAFVDAADRVGFPVMIKASAGGGGRGMRLVHERDALPAALAIARSESLQAFGSDHLILERAVVDAKHVEVQVLADTHGTIASVGERDCSVQRRHQKLIEEAPCMLLTATQRQALCDAARNIAQSTAYTGAGTVEFLVDASGAFYFLEMNTRIQVEHPVTELVSGVDLVAWQLRIARGEPLDIELPSVVAGHAIEVRICAEQPDNDFLPSSGTLSQWHVPRMPNVRVDTGVVAGSSVSASYDSMLAKMIAWGETRESARRRLLQALRATRIIGVTTNLSFLIAALENPRFVDASATTTFVETMPVTTNHVVSLTDLVVAAVLDVIRERDGATSVALSPTAALHGWSSADPLVSHHRFVVDGEQQAVTVTALQRDRFVVTCDEAAPCEVKLRALTPQTFDLLLDGRVIRGAWQAQGARYDDSGFETCRDGITLSWRNTLRVQAEMEDVANDGDVVAPMHGKIVSIDVAVADTVRSGTVLCVLEAMKMQHSIVATAPGVVATIDVAVDQQVAHGDVLMQCDGIHT